MRDKANFVIKNYLKDLTIQQLEFLDNVKLKPNFKEFVSICQILISGMEHDAFLLDESDPNLAVRKSKITGATNGIIILKQLFEYSASELNDRMKEE